MATKSGEKQISAHLPEAVVNKFKKFVKVLNEINTGIDKITEKKIIYNALTEYLNKNYDKAMEVWNKNQGE